MKELLDYMKRSLPKYSTTQPSTGKRISFTPFTVKEEKALLMSNSTGNREDFLLTIANTINSCFEVEDAKNLPMFDIEYFFINLRAKSVGEIIESTIVCPYTQEKINIAINLEDIKPEYFNDHDKRINLDNIIVTMRYPTLMDFVNKKETDDYYDMMVKCIDTIETSKELIESKNCSDKDIVNFIESLTKQQFNKLIKFFKTMPKIQKKIEYKTSDGETREIILRGIRDFFQ